MALAQIKHIIGVFPNHLAAEQALGELTDAGFPMECVSVIAKMQMAS